MAEPQPMKLEDLQPHAAVRGVLPDALATVISVQWFGSEALELTYKGPSGRVARAARTFDKSGDCLVRFLMAEV